MKISLFILAAGLATLPALAQPQAKPEVLVLGVYHMANPGHDIYNTKADDVLAPKRQAEIEQLIEVLERFHPTKVGVEADVWDRSLATRYNDYVAGKHELTRNEIEQIGFRLAKKLGHTKVYAVDADGDFPYPRLLNYVKGAGKSKEFDAISNEIGAKVKEQNDYLATHSVLETLVLMNSDESIAKDVGFYYRQAAFGEPGDWPGADLLADWYRRNMRIYTNVMKAIDSPADRILVIFGAGHLGWLQHDFASNPDVRLRKLAEFVKDHSDKR